MTLERIESRLRLCFWLYLGSSAVVLIIRYTIFRSSVGDANLILYLFFMTPSMVFTALSQDAASRQLRDYLKYNHPDILKEHYFSWTPMLTLKGMRRFLYHSDNMGDQDIKPYKDIARKGTNLLMLQGGLFIPLGLVIIT